MKKIFVILISAAAGLGVGVPFGWLLRKKVAEVQFVETTEEEQIAAMIANGDEHMIPVNENEIKRPIDIQKAIDGAFARAEVPEDLQATVQKDIDNEKNREAGIRQLDTQKEQYFKHWKEDAQSIAAKYDTTTKDFPDEVADLPDDVKEFIGEGEEADEDDMATGRPNIDPTGKEDWDRWTVKPDGAYDCVEVYWFEDDDVLCDEDHEQIENPEKFVGFSVREQFEKTDGGEEPDVRYIYNHGQRAIFKLIRKHTSFSRKRGMEEFGSDYDEDGDDSEDFLRSKF